MSSNYRDWLEAARTIQQEADAAGIGRFHPESDHDRVGERSLTAQFNERVTDPRLQIASRRLFVDGHYTQAVEEAFKRLNNEVKAMSGFEELDGDKLMRQAFSANNPKLHLNSLSTISQKDEQRGYMDIFAGAMTGVRNPRAHDHELVDEPEVALELLVLANHLMRKLESATKE